MYKRVFLNKPKQHSIALVLAHVSGRKRSDGTVRLMIGDCAKQIELSLDSYDEDDRENSLYKIDKLVAVLTEFRDALHEKFERAE